MTTEPEQGSHPSWRTAVLTPWACMLRPAKAGVRLVNAPPAAFGGALAVALLVLAATVIGLLLWNDTIDAEYVWTAASASAPATGMSLASSSHWVLKRKTFGEVWAEWHRRGPIGPAELLAIGIPLFVVACIAFGAWLHLVTIHEGGSVWGSYKRAFRAVTACTGLLCVLTAALAALMVSAEHMADVSLAAGTFTESFLWAAADVAMPVSIAGLLAWIGAAVRTARVPTKPGASAPRCEGCGYDLTHVPQERRCPECGLDVEMSLTPRYSRPGCAWEDSPGVISWVTTSLAVLAGPGVFYRRLRLRTPEKLGRRFALWHYVVLGFAGAAWALMVAVIIERKMEFVSDRQRFENLVLVPATVFLWVPICAWVIHQTTTALMVSWALARAELTDIRSMRKVAAYESVFLWLPGLFVGGLVGSFIAWDTWISQRLFGAPGLSGLRGAPAEATVLWVGVLGLFVLWLRRYYVAIRAVRWANF